MAATKKSYTKLALMILLVGLISLEIGVFTGGSLNIGNVLMVMSCLMAALLIYISPRIGAGKRFYLIGPDYVYITYLAWCALSALWSLDPIGTLTQTIYLGALWLGCSAVGMQASPSMAANYLLRAAVVIALASFAMIPVSSQLAFQPFSSTGLPELRGVFAHQLRLGAFMSVCVAFIMIGVLDGSSRSLVGQNAATRWAMFLILFICMVAALARSYTAYMLLALPISILLSRRGWIRWTTIVLVGAMVTFIMIYADQIVGLLGDEGGDVTLSGRTRVWEVTMSAYEEGPALRGMGYATFNLPAFDSMWNYYRPPHPHNSFIAALFETGLIGAVLTAVFILSQIVTVVRSANMRRATSLGLFLIIMTFLASLTGVNYAGKPSTLFGLTMLFVAIEGRLVGSVNSVIRKQRSGARRASKLQSVLPAAPSSSEVTR
ncbi:O-antigen ligase family protein [Novosphingobium sp. RD2P27]|uniref:O-antigen ligase family protein n=1 Tax=Novosphingobium kalidii TaxID=3230299 RepID=A0ABV2CX64_9SPHN